MRRAQAICRRLRKRDIYAFAREVTIPPRYDDNWKEPSAAGASLHRIANGGGCPLVLKLQQRFWKKEGFISSFQGGYK